MICDEIPVVLALCSLPRCAEGIPAHATWRCPCFMRDPRKSPAPFASKRIPRRYSTNRSLPTRLVECQTQPSTPREIEAQSECMGPCIQIDPNERDTWKHSLSLSRYIKACCEILARVALSERTCGELRGIVGFHLRAFIITSVQMWNVSLLPPRDMDTFPHYPPPPPKPSSCC